MAFFISSELSAIKDFITTLVYFMILFGIPIGTLILLILFIPLFCCCGCAGKKCHRLQKKFTNVVHHIYFFLKKDDGRFIVYGYKAPICYTYFLLFIFLVLCVHCFSTFWGGAIHNSENIELENLKKTDPDSLLEKCYTLYDGTADKNQPVFNQSCIEVRLLDGLQAASLSFGLSALTIAILTRLLLKVTRGNQAIKKCSCRNVCCSLSIAIIQTILIFAPRFFILLYAVYFVDWDAEFPFVGLIDEDSSFVIVAIFDAVSLTMLTPWLCFEKEKKCNETTAPRIV